VLSVSTSTTIAILTVAQLGRVVPNGDPAALLQHLAEALQREAGAVKREVEAQEQQTATAEILRVMPSGPDKSSSTGGPIFRSRRRAVCRVAVSAKRTSVSRLNVAQATRSTFLLSCAMMANLFMRGLLIIQ
jgi:hypothetical protein